VNGLSDAVDSFHLDVVPPQSPSTSTWMPFSPLSPGSPACLPRGFVTTSERRPGLIGRAAKNPLVEQRPHPFTTADEKVRQVRETSMRAARVIGQTL